MSQSHVSITLFTPATMKQGEGDETKTTKYPEGSKGASIGFSRIDFPMFIDFGDKHAPSTRVVKVHTAAQYALNVFVDGLAFTISRDSEITFTAGLFKSGKLSLSIASEESEGGRASNMKIGQMGVVDESPENNNEGGGDDDTPTPSNKRKRGKSRRRTTAKKKAG